jgi:uncharacterized protein YegL
MRTEDKEKIEYVLFVLDESGSMESIKKETITGLNEQIQELRKTSNIKTYVSLVKFSGSVDTLYWNRPLEEVLELTNETYTPNGATAMLDAVGISVNRLRNETTVKDNDVSYLVVIVSDGAENASREYTWDMVRELITKCKDDKAWTVTYLGANQDLTQVRQSLNIDIGNTLSYITTGTGTQYAFTTTGSGLANYRNLRSSAVDMNALLASGVMSSFYSSVTNSAGTNSEVPPTTN